MPLRPIGLIASALCAVSVCCAQIVPEASQVFLFFPQFFDGGPPSSQWQTKLNLVNPNNIPASVTLNFLGDDGSPVKINFGSGAVSTLSLTIPASGSTILRSIPGATLVGGWILGAASSPIQANDTFHTIQNGAATAEIGVNSTLPTSRYISAASSSSSIALANSYSDISVPITVALTDSAGNPQGQQTVTVPPSGHRFFALSQIFPNLAANFTGSVTLKGLLPANAPPQTFVAWTLDADGNSPSPVPDGRANLPVSQRERIWLVFQRVLAAVYTFAPLGTQNVNLVIAPDPVVNAFGNADGIQINLALAQLISDSESELAFTIGHELGHVYQQRSGQYFLYPIDPQYVEFDADAFGTAAAISAGFDPYGSAGALAKLAMATGSAALTTQFENQSSADAHKSFNNRLEALYDILSLACGSSPEFQSTCNAYKYIFHPNLPAAAPLSIDKPDN